MVSEPEIYPYRLRDDFLSPAEASFYRVLKSILAERLLICPKVSLAEIFFVSRSDSSQAYQNKIDRKRVDFLLCDPKMLKPVLGIELDDSSHRRPDRQERDAFVKKVFADAKNTTDNAELMVKHIIRRLCQKNNVRKLTFGRLGKYYFILWFRKPGKGFFNSIKHRKLDIPHNGSKGI